MIIKKYGIVLSRLISSDIEMVRMHRNSPQINRNMVYRQHITQEMQKKWFASVDNETNCYFIIEYGGKKTGLTNAANIDWVKKTSESGIFIWDADFIGTHLPLCASLCSFEFFFNILGIKESGCKIVKGNPKGIEYNEFFGYERCRTKPGNTGYDRYTLTAERYNIQSARVKALVQKISGDYAPLNCTDFDFSIPQSPEGKIFYAHLPVEIRALAIK